jgi:SNF2 family DNA or RNA helicase
LEENKKCIVFTNYNAVLDELEKRLKNKCVRLDGSVEAKERQRLVDEFQTNDEIKVFISNIIAGGTGITLTKAQTTIFNDLHFTPAIHAQSEDRNHRIGVEHDVTIYYPLFDNSVDSIVYNILDKKKKVIDQAIEGITPNEEQSSVLTEIIDAIENNFNI